MLLHGDFLLGEIFDWPSLTAKLYLNAALYLEGKGYIREGEGGQEWISCFWAKGQTSYSIRINLTDETYKCVSNIEQDDHNPTTMADVKEQEMRFRITDALKDICEKLILRHLYTFGNTCENPDEMMEQWPST